MFLQHTSFDTHSSVDMLAHAIDNPAPSTIVLISGDRDFAYPLSILRLRRYHIVLITLSNAHPSLKAQASLCFNWFSDVSGTVQPTSPRRGKTSIPPTNDRYHSDIKSYNLSRFTFQEPYDEKSANSVEFINHVQDNPKEGDICLTPRKCDFRPDFSPPELEPSKRQPATSMSSTNSRNEIESPARVIYSPVASSSHALPNYKIETPLIIRTETSHDSNSSQTLPSSDGNTPKRAPHGDVVASGFHTLRGSTSLPNLVLGHEVASATTQPVSSQQTQILPPEPDLRGFSTSPSPQQQQQQNKYSIKSDRQLAVNQTYDPDGNPNSSPAHLNISPTNVATSLPTPSFTPPSSINHTTTTTTAMPTVAAQSPKKVKTTNPTPQPSPLPPPPPPPSPPPPPPPAAVPDKFKTLVEYLKTYRSKGNVRPLRTQIAVELSRDSTTYRQAGVTKFRDYAAMAEKEGIIELGGWQGTAWIALLEQWV